MRLGGTIVGNYVNAEEWEQLLVRSGFRAITAPFSCRTAEKEIRAYWEAAAKHDVVIAEVGVWRNLLDPDPRAAAEAVAFAKGQLALAERLDIPCCVNIAGTPGSAGWDAADPANYTPEVYERTIAVIREILDEVQPLQAYYCLEPMPWMVPDGPDEYLQMIRDVNRPQFGVHMDFVNMIHSPRRFLAAEEFIGECFRKLAPYIRSTHIKDIRMDPVKLTTILEECSPGEGALDFEKILGIIHRCLPADAPVLLEHMQTETEYHAAYMYLKDKAEKCAVPV